MPIPDLNLPFTAAAVPQEQPHPGNAPLTSPRRASVRRGCVPALVLVVWSMLPAAPVRADEAERPADPAAIAAGHLLAPKAFRAAVERVLPSVVTIESFGGLSRVGGGAGRGISKPGEGQTTGIIVSEDGYVVTSTYNFLARPPVITVILQDGSRHVAKLLGRDETRKICLLKVDGVRDWPVPEFVPRSQLKVGQWAVSVGVGFGDSDAAISAGIISATSRINGRAVQTDANTSPANYGGPLVDISGRVIGVCVPLSPQSPDVASGVEWYDSGIGFAVPLAEADRLLAALKEGKTIQPAALGVQVKPADEQGQGAVIVQVVEGSAAARAGLKPDDRILSIDGQEILDPAHLRTVVGSYNAGDEATLKIQRGESELELKATFDVAPSPQPRAPKPQIKPIPKPQPKPE